MTTSDNKHFGLEFARAIACFMVIVLHVSSLILSQPSEAFYIANSFESLVRSCVPIFFMVSGALLLNTNYPLNIFFKKRLSRIIPPLFFWTAFYAAWLRYNHAPLPTILKGILPGPMMYHLWYLYAIIGLYAFIPIIKTFYKNATRNEVAYYLTLWALVFSILPYFEILTGLNINFVNIFHLNLFGGYTGYMVLGAFIFDLNKTKLKGRTILFFTICVFIAASLITGILTVLFSSQSGKLNELFYNYNSPFVVLAGASLFAILVSIKEPKNKVFSTSVKRISKHSLGIYCIHIFVMEMLSALGLSAKTGTPILFIPITSISVLLVAEAIIALMNKFKILRPFC